MIPMGIKDIKLYKRNAIKVLRDNTQYATAKAVETVFDKRIPRKPEYYGDGYSDGKLVYDYAKCPVCGRDDFEYDINNWGCNYCPDCGQALDWGDIE